MTHRKRTSILLVISFVLILVGSFFSNAINTDFGKIKTDRLYLMNDNGYTVSARIYIPKTARCRQDLCANICLQAPAE